MGFSQALKPLRWIPGSEPFLSATQLALESASSVAKSAADLNKFDISNARKAVQDALNEAALPVVVFVDDDSFTQTFEPLLIVSLEELKQPPKGGNGTHRKKPKR